MKYRRKRKRGKKHAESAPEIHKIKSHPKIPLCKNILPKNLENEDFLL
jgi:hypothetical protein